jgi:hypothetical protein
VTTTQNDASPSQQQRQKRNENLPAQLQSSLPLHPIKTPHSILISYSPFRTPPILPRSIDRNFSNQSTKYPPLSLALFLHQPLLRLLAILTNQVILPLLRPHNLPATVLARLVGNGLHDLAAAVFFAFVILQDGDARGGEVEGWVSCNGRRW